jgi:hypothetical protein
LTPTVQHLIFAKLFWDIQRLNKVSFVRVFFREKKEAILHFLVLLFGGAVLDGFGLVRVAGTLRVGIGIFGTASDVVGLKNKTALPG